MKPGSSIKRAAEPNEFQSTQASHQYTYDNASNVKTRTDSDGTVTSFGYDASDQLTSEVRDNSHNTGYSVGYAYDHNGNRVSKVQGGVTTAYAYDHHDKLLSAGSKSYGYDLNGNCTSVSVGTSVTNLTYDIENRVVGISYPGGGSNAFAYNGDDLRTKKVDSTGTQNYVTDGSSPASAVLKDGNAVYTQGLSERRGSASKFYHGDALGSTRGITDNTQAVTDSQLYDAFGNTVSRTGTTPTPFGFVGKAQYQSDSDSGLQLLGHRYYDPSIGRFLSSDPKKAGTNWYAYCDNNPLKSIDPLGLEEWWQQIGNFAIGELKGFADQLIEIGEGPYGPFLPPSWRHPFDPGPAAPGDNESQQNGYQTGHFLFTIASILAVFIDGGCFVAGTPVQMADGTTKPIEKIHAGDQVLSRSQWEYEQKQNKTVGYSVAKGHKEKVQAKAVVRTFVHHEKTLVLRLANGEEITTTAQHPFYVENKGFVRAGHLGIGNAIVTRAGPALKIRSLHYTGKTQTVYNFEVKDFHTYFVGNSQAGLWVHNDCSNSGSPSNPPSSGTTKPGVTGPPDSVYTHVTNDGRALQNAIYDGDGNVIGHVDFKNHGGATSGHWHDITTPGDPSSGHGPGLPHNPPGTAPPGWGDLPPGVIPHTPIGK